MKRVVALKPHLSVEQIRERLYGSKNGHHASYWQLILTISLNPGKSTKEYCGYLGISDTKFYHVVSFYNQHGALFCEALQWGGRREKRCLLSVEQEETLLQSWEATALEGGVLVAKQLRQAVEQKIGHRVSDDYLWDLLKRHGWRKKTPRPEHPRAAAVKEKREAFKKKFPTSLKDKEQRQSP
ncbi:winged helix-turn-helix domain-containing protein [Flavisolibacter nicotianae]|uniref:winged helix-turn-helix domain-containing protein n=1 Tax=Flavisolibacter nicotianae TaxID=2364882 RepID=UPI000EAD80FF|nr:winged helix-turn-helix domain-containing protein [Flavisolibacter nicotianae]